MQLSSGSRLGPYEILSRIGAGGMGEVFKARDTRLERSVAIKVLPAEFASNAALKLRFEREAKTISQLNHPHICTLHDVGQHDGVEFLVMELIEGESLADRLSRGAMPLDDVFRYGAQIADALDRAHRAGIVHRDLKPANIMITKSGAKLLDFGLAKSAQHVVSVSGTEETIQRDASRPLTEKGTLLGTFQYMAPEQLEGVEADVRTDIFALGTVLYEMATGHRAFEGKTRTSLIAAIVGGTPRPIHELAPLTPAALEHVVTRCLAKEPDDRWQSAHDVAQELRWASERSPEAKGVVSRRRMTPWLIALAALLIAGALASMLWLRRPNSEQHLVLSLAPPSDPAIEFYDKVVLSPDGTKAVFSAYTDTKRSLWLRSIDSGEVRELPGSEGGRLAFWSPDGANIAFFADGKLKRLSAAGGPPQTIADAPEPFGGSWSSKGTIVFAPSALTGLSKVDADGGAAQPLTRLGPHEEAHRWPFFLPDGEHFLFLGDAWLSEDHHLKIGSVRGGEPRDLMNAITNAIYVEPGYVLFVRGGSLFARPFDARALEFKGTPLLVAENIESNWANHHFEFSAARNGRLTYRSVSPLSRLAWVDRSGRIQQTITDARHFGYFALSPDERSVVFETLDDDGRNDDLWVFDIARQVTTRLTVDPAADVAPNWSPDGTTVVYSSMKKGMGNPLTVRPGDLSSVQQLLEVSRGAYPTSWSPDGRFVALDYTDESKTSVWLYSMETKKATPYFASSFSTNGAVFSPDGKKIAYCSNESGRAEVFVEDFPTHAQRRQMSTSGGVNVSWAKDSGAVYFMTPNRFIVMAELTSANATPIELFRLRGTYISAAKDGRFLTDDPVEDVTRVPVTIVTDWTAALKK